MCLQEKIELVHRLSVDRQLAVASCGGNSHRDTSVDNSSGLWVAKVISGLIGRRIEPSMMTLSTDNDGQLGVIRLSGATDASESLQELRI
jgi:hypothetical protein